MEMGDFSQPSDVYKRNIKVDLASALRESISFGRFLSESFDWEKWSAFSHNKHLEDAKNCSVPGSVAQKKAYFEAHYRRPASKKLTAELGPVNDKTNIGFSCTKAENEEPKIDDSSCMKAESEEQKNPIRLKSPCKFDENHGLETMEDDKGTPVTAVEFHSEHSLQIKSSNKVQNSESEVIAYDSDIKQQDKKPMKEVFIMNHENEDQNKKKSAAYIIKSIDIHEESRISSSSASTIQKSISKENKPPQNRMEISLRSSDIRKPASESLHMSISSNSIQRGQKPSLGNKIFSFYEKVGDSKASCTSSRPSECTSSRTSELYNNHIKTLPTVGDSKTSCTSSRPSEFTSSRTSELHDNHIKTLSTASKSGPKHIFSTPQLEHKRTQTPLYETSSTRRKVCPLSINCFKSPSARENRQLFDRSVSFSCKTNEKIPVTKPASPKLARSNSKSSAETPLLRSLCKRNKTKQMNVVKGPIAKPTS